MAVNGGRRNSYIWLVEDEYLTIGKNSVSNYRDRGSKFIAYAFEIRDVNEAQQYLNQVKESNPSATHHCFAWRLGIKGEQYRAYDDGEPAGTAGRPIYDAIRSAGITHVMVVVVRYFGGTQLGKAGLIQAYKEVSVQALFIAGVTRRTIVERVCCQFSYEFMNVVMTELKKAEAVNLKMDSSDKVSLCFEIRISALSHLKTILMDRTRSQIIFLS